MADDVLPKPEPKEIDEKMALQLRHMIEDNERHLYKSRTGGKLWWALFFEIWHQDVYGSPAVKL